MLFNAEYCVFYLPHTARQWPSRSIERQVDHEGVEKGGESDENHVQAIVGPCNRSTLITTHASRSDISSYSTLSRQIVLTSRTKCQSEPEGNDIISTVKFKR